MKEYTQRTLANELLTTTAAREVKTLQLKDFEFFKLCPNYSDSLRMSHIGEIPWTELLGPVLI